MGIVATKGEAILLSSLFLQNRAQFESLTEINVPLNTGPLACEVVQLGFSWTLPQQWLISTIREAPKVSWLKKAIGCSGRPSMQGAGAPPP